MNRINVSFSSEVIHFLQARKQKKNKKSLAQSVRELVDLGSRIEDAAEKNNLKNIAEDESKTLSKLIQKNLIWSLEVRLLARCLIEQLDHIGEEKRQTILRECRETAERHIQNLLLEESD